MGIGAIKVVFALFVLFSRFVFNLSSVPYFSYEVRVLAATNKGFPTFLSQDKWPWRAATTKWRAATTKTTQQQQQQPLPPIMQVLQLP